ncbi:MAG: hypothetical protein QOJ98_2058 [Acidobacteriota bacterium]|jgi:hypothetical protein|nr:hypothetical protein [Acidobacteriota bacterium]
MTTARTEWVKDRVRDLHGLYGQTVMHWRAVEMAFREVGRDGLPQFQEAVPVLQLSVIHVTFAANRKIAIQTYQDDDEWGLFYEIPDESILLDLEEGIFRSRDLHELPRGLITDVQIHLNDRGNISRVTLSVGNTTTILLVAGEAYEQTDGTLRFARDDESILVFPSAADEHAVVWV